MLHSFKIYRGSRRTVLDNSLPAYVAQTTGRGMDIVIPATTKAVVREAQHANYPRDHEITIATATRASTGVITVTTTTAHGLSTGNQVVIDGCTPVPPTAGRLNGHQSAITVTGSTTFTMPSNELTVASMEGGVVIVMTANTTETYPDAFSFDTVNGLAVTAISTTTTAVVPAGKSLATLTVASTASFPNEVGYLVVGFGTQYESGPVKYLGRQGANNLVLDRAFNFGHNIPSGADVTLLSQKTPWEPSSTPGAFYLTGTASGRVAAETFLNNAIAVGNDAQITVVYPGDVGLAGEGQPAVGVQISDKVAVWGSDDLDAEISGAHNG